MNLRNRKLVIVIRVLLGLMFLGSGVSGLASGGTMTGVPEPMIATLKVLWATGIFQMIKVTEAVSGLMLIFGFYPALALLFIAPVCIGIIVFNSQVAPAFIVSGIVVSVLTAYLGYAYFDKYRAIFTK